MGPRLAWWVLHSVVVHDSDEETVLVLGQGVLLVCCSGAISAL
jgi:hypothetical protein